MAVINDTTLNETLLKEWFIKDVTLEVKEDFQFCFSSFIQEVHKIKIFERNGLFFLMSHTGTEGKVRVHKTDF